MSITTAIILFLILGIFICVFAYLLHRGLKEIIVKIDQADDAAKKRLKEEVKAEILAELKKES